jgi:glycosyltransferase involved in cell wall biosynthesis
MRISVVTPCFNSEPFIGDAIRSILAQTYTDLECIVVDDGSTDGSKDSISSLAERDPRTRPIFLEQNYGAAIARNRGIEIASGEWITFLDADDLYEPNRLERLLDLAKITNSVMVVDNQSVRDFPDGPHLFAAFPFLRGAKPIEITQELYFQQDAVRATHLLSAHLRLPSGYMKGLIARPWIQELGIRFNPKYRSGHDGFFYGELFAHRSRCFGTSYMGYIYRRRAGSLSASGPQNLRLKGSISSDLIERHRPHLSKSSIISLTRRQRVFDGHAAMHDIRFALRDGDFRRALSVMRAHPNVGLSLIHALQRRMALVFARVASRLVRTFSIRA